VRTTWAEVDVIVLCQPANEKIGPGDRYIAAELAQLRHTPVVAAVTTDLVSRAELAAQLVGVGQLGAGAGLDFAEIVPVSAVEGGQVDLLADLLLQRLPEGPPLYPDGELTDEPAQVMVAELIREAAFQGVHEELRIRSRSWCRRWDCARTGRNAARYWTSTRPSTWSGRRRRRS
jgi:GTP-binding protein Era